MAEINYSTEKCWRIKEQLPVTMYKVRVNNVWRLDFNAMTLSYDTFNDLTTSIHGGCGDYYCYKDGHGYIGVTDEGLKELEAKTNIVKIV